MINGDKPGGGVQKNIACKDVLTSDDTCKGKVYDLFLY